MLTTSLIFALVMGTGLVLLLSSPAFANPACAVCTVAVGAALGISRELGVDDTVIGIWTGAFLMLMFFWLVKFCAYKKWHFKGLGILLFVLAFALILPIYTMDYISYGARTVLGLDAFLFSIVIGALILWLTDIWYRRMKAAHGGHAHFPFEKVVIPVVCLALASAVFYFWAEDIITTNLAPLPQFDSI